ncbi:Sperm-associated antigen 7-like [Exaiptasia diaphana]|nr:Sperm-associated antigen 7-like [Exaiptasia diaphana]
MDLLGSILDSMDAPPKTENKEEKEKKRKLLKIQKEERKKKAEFRTKIEKDVNDFIQDEKRTRHKYPPMNKIQRTIVHDVAEVAGLTTFSFGEDEVDRYVMLFKKEFPPPDEELEAYRNGEFQVKTKEIYDPLRKPLMTSEKERKPKYPAVMLMMNLNIITTRQSR